MARAIVVTQQISREPATAPLMTAVTADGDAIEVGNGIVLEVDNGGGSPITVTVVSTQVVDGLDVEDLVVSVPAGQRRLIGSFSRSTFAQPQDAVIVAERGRAYVNYSAITDVTRAVHRF